MYTSKRRLRWFGYLQYIENVSRATQALYTNTGYQLKRGEEEDLGLHGETQYEGHEPDECDVG